MSILPFGRSNVVSLKLILTLLAAVDVAVPLCGFVASSRTFNEAIACSCVAFSSTLPAVNEFVHFKSIRSGMLSSHTYRHASDQWCESLIAVVRVEISHQSQ